MTDFSQIIQSLSEYGVSPLNIILIIMVAILMANMGIKLKFWEKKKETEEHVPTWAKRLMEHYNDETTDKLRSIKEDTSAIRGRQDEWERRGVPMKG